VTLLQSAGGLLSEGLNLISGIDAQEKQMKIAEELAPGTWKRNRIELNFLALSFSKNRRRRHSDEQAGGAVLLRSGSTR
jgi:hypothetical protein